jgi:hypothetical protein
LLINKVNLGALFATVFSGMRIRGSTRSIYCPAPLYEGETDPSLSPGDPFGKKRKTQSENARQTLVRCASRGMQYDFCGTLGLWDEHGRGFSAGRRTDEGWMPDLDPSLRRHRTFNRGEF